MDKIDIIAKRIANEEKLTRIAKKLGAGIHDDIKIEKVTLTQNPVGITSQQDFFIFFTKNPKKFIYT